MEEIFLGTVIFFSPTKGWGFIRWENKDSVPQRDMFIHYSDIKQDGFRTLEKDQRVNFSIGTNKNGDPKAISVVVIK